MKLSVAILYRRIWKETITTRVNYHLSICLKRREIHIPQATLTPRCDTVKLTDVKCATSLTLTWALQFLTFIFYSSHGDFVTIIDLPEGEHQYKFCVDGEWKHDPGVVCIWNKIKRAY
jgi:hypothetical protein